MIGVFFSWTLAGCAAPPAIEVDSAAWSGPPTAAPTADPVAWPDVAPADEEVGTTLLRATTLTLYAVRHAEKESEGDDPGLTEEGAARASALAERLAGVPIDAVYATDLRRTQDTVRPTADAHGLPIVTDVDAEEELAAHLLTAHRGDTVLHAGHSYTLPELFEDLGLPDLDVDGYGQLWIVTVPGTGEPTAVETTFGEPADG